ncbi:MAG: paraquat-inducible protein A [Sneathiella sp.]
MHTKVDLQEGSVGLCRRCGTVLFKKNKNSLNRTLAYALTGLIFFLIANIFPLLIFSLDGNTQSNRIVDGAFEFIYSGYWPLGLMVLFTSVIAPLVILLVIVSLLLPLQFQRIPVFPEFQIFVFVHLRPWAMAEIFIIGIMVAYVKLGDFADVYIGVSLVAFVLMVFFTVMSFLSFDLSVVWRKLDEIRQS